MKYKLEFPSHIKKFLIDVNHLLKEIDLIIFVSDARSISATTYPDSLLNKHPNIKFLNLVSKSDLSDAKIQNSFNFKIQKNRSKIIQLIKSVLLSTINFYKSQGYDRSFQILILGLPNVGKSTLINLLKNKKISPVKNQPGITKKLVKYYLGDKLWMYDTPGVFIPKNISQSHFDKLFLLNCLPFPVENYSDILERAFKYLQKYDFSVEDLNFSSFVSYPQFLNFLSKKYNFKIKEGDVDIYRSENKFLDILRNSRVCWDYE